MGSNHLLQHLEQFGNRINRRNEVYHIFDMGTTTNNCLGDLAGTIFVSRMEDKQEA